MVKAFSFHHQHFLFSGFSIEAHKPVYRHRRHNPNELLSLQLQQDQQESIPVYLNFRQYNSNKCT